MNKTKALALARDLARRDKIAFTTHAKKRNPKAGKYPLSREQVKECVLRGQITEGPYPDVGNSGWKFTMKRFADTENHEAVLIIKEDVLVILVVTAYATSGKRR